MATAKVFWSGRSQAVRLPRDFRFEGSEVCIRRLGQAVLLEPVTEDWTWLEGLVDRFDPDFVQAALDRPHPITEAPLPAAQRK